MRKLFLSALLMLLGATLFAQRYTSPEFIGGDASLSMQKQIEGFLSEGIDLAELGVPQGGMFFGSITFSVNAEGKVEGVEFDPKLQNQTLSDQTNAKVRLAIKERLAESEWRAGTKDDAPCKFDLTFNMRLICR